MHLGKVLDRLNSWFWRAAGGDERPRFLDIDAVRPELRRVDAAFPQIRAEALALISRRDELPTLHETDMSQVCVSGVTPHNWRVFYLTAAAVDVAPNRARCPATVAALDRVPGVFQAWFSILDPGKSIPPHRGPFAGYVRYHLGLVVPEDAPPRMRLEDEVYTWSEGASVLFDDSFEHEVFNTSAHPRMILIVDIARPMPFPYSWVNWGARRLVRRLYGRPVAGRVLEWAEP
jgi:aspartyl/asparaginyl beta-hydroxylase (cupin superfamily)